MSKDDWLFVGCMVAIAVLWVGGLYVAFADLYVIDAVPAGVKR